MAVVLKSSQEIEKMRRAGHIVREVLETVRGLVKPGVTTFDLEKAAASKAYCDEIKGICKDAGVEITELSTHLQGQLVAVHPAYDAQMDGFAPPKVHNNPKARQKWAVEQMKAGARASRSRSSSASLRPK